MSPNLLKLHLSQLSKAIQNSKTNYYSDNRKQNYHNTLNLLFEKIYNIDIDSLSNDKQLELKQVIDFIFLSFEFLDNSRLRVIPYEIVYCLEKALKDWDSSNNYIIVTTLNNDINGYYFNPKLSLNTTIYDILDKQYNVQFEYKFIQISLPKYLVHDYLANVVLYHELGHFIDRKFEISNKLTNYLCNQKLIDCSHINQVYNHISEYFADIFAAQYVGNSSSKYLDYIAHNAPNSLTHPKTDDRIKIVDDFLSANSTNFYIEKICWATEQITSKKLEKRHTLISENDIIQFIPPEFENDEEMHSIFQLGWNLWIKDIPQFTNKGIQFEEKYKIINNLIEKSISNYMVCEKWKQCS